MWIRQAAITTTLILLLSGASAHAAKGDDRACDQAIALAEARRNTIRTEVRRRQQSDSHEAASLRIIDDFLRNAGKWRDRRDWQSCVWHAEEAYNFGRPNRSVLPTQTN